MRRYLCIMLAGLPVLAMGSSILAQDTATPAAAVTSSDEIAAEWKRVAGLWRPKSAVLAGDKLPAEICTNIRLRISEGAFQSDSNGERSAGKMTLDPASTPAAMDLIIEEGAEAGKTLKCAYKLENDLLYVAYSIAMDGVRPPEFESNQDNKLLVLVYERTDQELEPSAALPSPDGKAIR